MEGTEHIDRFHIREGRVQMKAAVISTVGLLLSFAAHEAGFDGAAYAQSKPPIIIGQALAFTGWMVTYDGQPARSMEIAVEDVNKAGGVLGGRMLEIVKCDTKTDREQGAKCGQEMVQKGAKFAAFSCDYDMGGPAALQFAAANIVGVSVCGSDRKIGSQGIGPTLFTMSTASNAQGYV